MPFSNAFASSSLAVLVLDRSSCSHSEQTTAAERLRLNGSRFLFILPYVSRSCLFSYTNTQVFSETVMSGTSPSSVAYEKLPAGSIYGTKTCERESSDKNSATIPRRRPTKASHRTVRRVRLHEGMAAKPKAGASRSHPGRPFGPSGRSSL